METCLNLGMFPVRCAMEHRTQSRHPKQPSWEQDCSPKKEVEECLGNAFGKWDLLACKINT